jgi:hypothetical protein
MSTLPTDDTKGRNRAERNLRLAARLRDNLRRRKAQSAARADAAAGGEEPGAPAQQEPTTDGKSA